MYKPKLPNQDRKCFLGENGWSFDCRGEIKSYTSHSQKCSFQTCNIKMLHTHDLCKACGMLFLEQKRIIQKR